MRSAGTTPSPRRTQRTRSSRRRNPVFIFDFGGVVIKWKNNNPIFDHIADRYDIPRLEMRRAFELTLSRLETGDVSIHEFLVESLRGFGKTLRGADSPDDLWTWPFESGMEFRKGTVDVVNALRKKGFQVFLFSNTSPPHASLVTSKGWDKLFDGFVSSCELRSMKPSATAFRRALARIGADPSDVVFVDDREENINGAKEFGIGWAFRFTSVAQLRRDVRLAIAASAPGSERRQT